MVSALTNKFGCRAVTVAGSVIASLAFLISTMAPSVDVLIVTYGIMGGAPLPLCPSLPFPSLPIEHPVAFD